MRPLPCIVLARPSDISPQQCVLTMSLLSYKRAALAALASVMFAATAAAQTAAVIDPRIVEFDPSADHTATNASGVPIVSRYDLELYVVGGTQPVQVANLGKPNPQTDGKIRVDFTTLLTPWPAPGTVYEARVAAVGPNGTGRSTESNTFAFSSPCSSSITPTSVSVGGGASTGSVAVAGITGCTWSATSNASWLSITAGASGNGTGTVSYSVAANATSTQRVGTLTISGHTFTVTQSGGCTYSTTPSSTTVSASATTGSVAVSTATGCGWTASSAVSWITITSGGSGSGNGSVGYSVAANTSTTSRTGTLTVAGRTTTITQEGAACTYGISPVGANVGSAATTGNVAVTAANGCAWTASSSASWITVTGGANGSGSGQVAYSVAANPGTSTRNGTMTIAGQTFTVTQAGQTCTFSLSPVSTSVPAGATSGTVSVDTLNGCTWNASASATWISITSGGSGTGDGTVAYNVAANQSLSSRTGTISVGDQTFTITQAGVVCSATIAPVSASVGSSGASGSVAITLPSSACQWTASSDSSWATIAGTPSGSGSATLNYSVAANSSTSSRSATLTIAGRSFSITQAGITCSYSVSPTTAAATAAAGSGSVTVTTAAGCSWSASSAVSWMSIGGSANRTGPGTVSYSWIANPTTQSRSGVLTIAGEAVSVTQAAGCGYTISPASASVGAAAGSGTITVNAGSACAWSAQSPASWITFSTATSGTGTGSVGYVVAANPDSSSRSATITVAGQPFVVTQAGAECDAVLTPASQAISAAGGNGNVNVALAGGCTWTAVPSVSWIDVLTGGSGSGNGTVTYSVEPNTAGTGRTGTIAIAGRLLTITQGAASCTATVSPTSQSVEAAGANGVVSVTIPAGCLWTATSNASWIMLTSGGGPNTGGSGAVTFTVAPNTSTSPRSGTLTVAGRTVTIGQTGTCDITISPTAVSAAADAATGSVSVTTGSSCSWSTTSSATWLTVTGGASGTGNGAVSYELDANTTNAVRTATLTIGGRIFSVTQAAPICAISLSATAVSLTSASAFRTVSVTTSGGCAWSAVSSVPWITVASGGSGSGPGSIAYSVAPNTSTATRTGTLRVGSETLAITQTGVACTFNLNPTSISIGSSATSESVSVTSDATCAWTATSNTAWLTVTSGSGTGNGTVQYTASANTSPFARIGTLTIAGRSFTVSQAGSSCTTMLSSSSVAVGTEPSSVSVNVSTGDGCNWTATSTATWIAVTGGATGSGLGTVTLSISEYTGSTSRTGSVSIAGRQFTVTQVGGCDYTVSPTSMAVGGSNSLALVTVTTAAGCAWTAQSPVSWITLNTGKGSGTSTLSLSVAANSASSPRSATLNIAGHAVVVNQAGAACNYMVSPTSMNISGGTHTITVTAPSGCAWTATTTAPWITFQGGTSGSGNGTVTVQFTPNEGATARFAFINLAGWRVFVTQRVATPPSAPGGMRIVVE